MFGFQFFFNSRLGETTLNSFVLTFHLTVKHWICILYQKTFIKKRIVLKISVKDNF